MTFMGKDRKQCGVIAAGGGGYLLSTPGTKIVAYALTGQQTPSVGQASVQPTSTSHRKHVLAWGEVRDGYQHESISHAFAVIERLGRESGLYDTRFRTDSQLITKHPITSRAGPASRRVSSFSRTISITSTPSSSSAYERSI